MPETWREKKALGTTFHALSRGHCWNKIQDTLGAGRFYTAEQENYPGKATLFIVIQLIFFFVTLMKDSPPLVTIFYHDAAKQLS